MECMANSDNVIRAGLTPKFRDVPNLVSGLTYIAAPYTKHTVQPSPFDVDNDKGRSLLYNPPVPEFAVVQVKVPLGEVETHRAVDGPSVMIVVEGGGKVEWGDDGVMDVGLGDVFFVGAGAEISTRAGGEAEELVAYRAFVEAD